MNFLSRVVAAAQILALDASCHVDLIKDDKEDYHQYFVTHLAAQPAHAVSPPQRCMAAFVLVHLCNNRNRDGQRLVLQVRARVRVRVCECASVCMSVCVRFL